MTTNANNEIRFQTKPWDCKGGFTVLDGNENVAEIQTIQLVDRDSEIFTIVEFAGQWNDPEEREFYSSLNAALFSIQDLLDELDSYQS